MQYLADIPEATNGDLARALASSDPSAFVQARLDELSALMTSVDTERRKWAFVAETIKAFQPVGTQPSAKRGDDPRADETHDGKRSYKSLSEYPSMLAALFDEESRRVWRTAELVDTLATRGLIDRNDPNEPNRVSRALKKLVDDKYIVAIKKGQYRRATPTTDYALAGDLGFPVPDSLTPNTEADP